MDTKQPEAIRIAERLEGIRGNTWPSYIPQEAAAELRRQHAEIETLRAGYSAARLEIESLRERVQQLGQLARDVNSRRVTELEAQLEAIGAGGVEPLRKRECLHQISEPAQPVAQAQDAARYQFLRDGEWQRTGLEPVIRLQLNTLWDSKIDAAIAAQKEGIND